MAATKSVVLIPVLKLPLAPSISPVTSPVKAPSKVAALTVPLKTAEAPLTAPLISRAVAETLVLKPPVTAVISVTEAVDTTPRVLTVKAETEVAGVDETLVRLLPSKVGSGSGITAAGIVPVPRLVALRFVTAFRT